MRGLKTDTAQAGSIISGNNIQRDSSIQRDTSIQRDEKGCLRYEMRLHVYMEDTDAGGIVYYVNYLKFMERARTDMFRALGLSKPAVFSDELMFVVHDIQAKYLRSAELDDELRVSAVITKLAKATVYFEQQVERLNLSDSSSELLCESQIKIACVNRSARKPAAIPAELRSLLQGHSLSQSTS